MYALENETEQNSHAMKYDILVALSTKGAIQHKTLSYKEILRSRWFHC